MANGVTERPIFVLASGWRTGSTLVQRLLCSHPDIHVWGENRGVILHLEQACNAIVNLQQVAEQHLADFHKRGSNGWLAMMNPPHQRFQSGVRALLEAYYREPALAFGKSRWGFKEVRYEMSTARFLHGLYPRARFILLVRHPEDCLASARATRTLLLKKGLLAEIGGVKCFLDCWMRIAASFLEPWDDEVSLRIRYEDMIAEPEEAIRRIGSLLDARPGEFDRSVFEVRRRGWLGRHPRLTSEDRASLEAEELWDVAKEYGYARS